MFDIAKGKTTKVVILSERGGKLRIKNPFGPSYFHQDALATNDKSFLEFNCKPNQTIKLDY